MIFPLPLLWYLSNLLFDRLGKQRVTPIIRPGNSELIAEVMGGGLPAMLQALSRESTRIRETPLLVRPLWHGLVVVTWCSRIFPRIVLENDPMSHVSYMQYPFMTLSIIILIIFSSFSPPFKPCMFWFKRAKNINSRYSPILHGCMNTRKVQAKFKNFQIILYSGCSSTILMRRLVGKLSPEKY